MNLFATCPKGLEALLYRELESLGANDLKETVAGVSFSGDLQLAYRACLWSRLANKVLLLLAEFPVGDQDTLYKGAVTVPWEEHLGPQSTFVVDFTGTTGAIRNTQFGALKIKDAIVDRLREQTGSRPSVSKQQPDLRINARLNKGRLALSLDLSGDSLHRRGYRTRQGVAPMKENLAAGVLIRAGWPAMARQGGALIDPMCGAATLLIEGAMMAADIAPGLGRSRFGFEQWLNHRNDIWLALREEAMQRKAAGLARPQPEVRGYDGNLSVIRSAEDNIIQAGLDEWLRVSRKELADLKQPTHKRLEPGLVITNPPYGERLGDVESLKGLYRHLGERLKAEFPGWQAAVFTGNPDLGKQMGLRAHKRYKLFNGPMPAELLMFRVEDSAFVNAAPKRLPHEGPAPDEPLSDGAQMLANRLQKNLKQLAKWVKKEGIQCYRLYDADMPEYSAAIDLYHTEDGARYAHVQEYAAPKSVDEARADQRFADIQAAVPRALELDADHISYKQRRRHSHNDGSQYQKLSAPPESAPLVVREGQARLQVNLWQYLDTGLFLDHRPVRLKIAQMARGARFLNLFCYTGTASIHAALGGARSTLSVDMSNTYLQWARNNIALNGLSDAKHRTERADCLEWLKTNEQTFDLILLDPPSFSNSKRMPGVLDIQRDHVQLIESAASALNPGGTLIFSTNLRSFTMDQEALSRWHLEDITAQTIDRDFQRNTKIHQCWLISA
ncbi:bifunctional 23S rRNA (guanine(2069)-N(7))-methyltransferase RlmK/23S rRNA (guanine(2445)-N(2))-methyltransferase RlmL [Marinimicrobium sp. ARAG 43.8]|uniref:bifunctional 23S rRNA (guanine(2069)-N(7))-methyltransferase RlmK/23S rRNA (guanine(2445)-N(2))-methyltransferase RlmL n=1 Tax=Marinimicrobium sp. ARAG 43.8 TaxID=3418719 RepID=UPI003CEC5FBC